MEISFTYTRRDLVDLVLRAQQSRPAYKRLHWFGMAVAAIVLCLLLLASDDGWSRLAHPATLVVLVLGLVGYRLATRWVNRWYVSKTVGQRYGPHEAIECTVTLEDGGVRFTDDATEILIKWAEMTQAKRTGPGVELWGPNGLVGLVRSPVPSDEDQLNAFSREVNRRMNANAQASGDGA